MVYRESFPADGKTENQQWVAASATTHCRHWTEELLLLHALQGAIQFFLGLVAAALGAISSLLSSPCRFQGFTRNPRSIPGFGLSGLGGLTGLIGVGLGLLHSGGACASGHQSKDTRGKN
jgi:hypothetical protein